MKSESEFEKISRKTGRKISFCKCQDCKKQCSVAPCLGTPTDIEKIIDAGFGNCIMATDWGAGILMGVTDKVIEMYQAQFHWDHMGCVFFSNGLCQLHDLKLKPTEGKLSHHTTRIDNFKPNKSVSWLVAKEWIDPKNKEIIERIKQKLKN